MANIKSINGNPIMVGTSGINDGAVTNNKLAQTGGVLDSIKRIDKSIDYLQSLTVDVVRPSITFTGLTNGIAITKNADGTVSTAGTLDAAINRTIGTFAPEVGKTYVFETGKEQESEYYWYLKGINGESAWQRVGYTWTCTTDSVINLNFTGQSGAVIDETVYPVIRELHTNASLSERIDGLETIVTDGNLNGMVGAVYSALQPISYQDDMIGSWSTPATYTNTPIMFDRDIVVGTDGNLNMRVMMRNVDPQIGGGTLTRVDWSTSAHVVRIPRGMWFFVNFRNLAADATITVDYIREHSFMKYYDTYSEKYIDDAVNEFKGDILEELDSYPVTFGVITDIHYPTLAIDRLPQGYNEYTSGVYRGEIENGCKALRSIASDLNLQFIVDCGDDAGYSTADNNVPNIIYSMTKMASCLRGGVPVMMLNGNHDAFQNNSDIDGGDIYRSRVVNQEGVTSVSNTSTNFYLDDEYHEIRFVFFDTELRTDYTQAHAEACLSEMLSSAPSGYTFILFSHRDITNNSEFANATNFLSVVTPYVSRIMFHVTGHLHRDDYFENAGIKNISFIAAGQYNYSLNGGPLPPSERDTYMNTDKEASFAIVGYNPMTRAVKVFGYGMAKTRTFKL